MADPEPSWTKSKWKADALYEKTVAFRLPVKGGKMEVGVGRFIISENPGGLLFVQIETDQGIGWQHRILTRYYLTQDSVDRIQEHPDKAVADFLLA